MLKNPSRISLPEAKSFASSLAGAVALVALIAIPDFAMAQSTGGFEDDACEFIGNIRNLLTIASVAVVTIAIIFAGYQIAFAHKRISDVAPILIGGLLIGAAGQLATWLLGGDEEDCTGTGGGGMALIFQEVTRYIS